MAPQTVVNDNMAPGYPGTKRSSTRYSTGINTEATAEIPYGCGVVQNKASGLLGERLAAKLPGASTDTFLGVAIRGLVSESALGATGNGPKPGSTFNIAYDGEVLVKVESAVVKGGRAFMRFAVNGGNTQLGIFRADADTASAVELKGCMFMHSGAAGSLVWMRISEIATRATQA